MSTLLYLVPPPGFVASVVTDFRLSAASPTRQVLLPMVPGAFLWAVLLGVQGLLTVGAVGAALEQIR